RPATGRSVSAANSPSAGAGEAVAVTPRVNPFMHELRFSTLQKAQIAIMTLTLFPIRLLFAAFMMLFAWSFAFVPSLGFAEREPEEPLLWQKVVDFPLKAVMQTTWPRRGDRPYRLRLPSWPLAPHPSYFHAVPVTMTMSSIVMKAESRGIPIWGTLIKYIRPVCPDQENSGRDKQRGLVQWEVMTMIFPEGTCTNGTCQTTFKTGVFILGVPVQPVVLGYPNKLDTIMWTWQGPGVLEMLWLALCQVEIEFLPVYHPSKAKRSPVLYASSMRRVMAETLGISVMDFTFEDLGGPSGRTVRLPSDTCLLEFARLVRGLGLKLEKLETDKKHKGEEGLVEFTEYLEVPLSDTLDCMFSDESGGGKMDLREYVIALSVVCRASETLDTIQLPFEMYTWQEDGCINEEDLSCILKTALGVAELLLIDLFSGVDEADRFAHTYPDFAEEYLYPDQAQFETCALLSTPTLNSLCTDFSPESTDPGRKHLHRKLD
uniref:Phospholipid/glycerol acyltransferase domain-containing protein n=1 Tax=Loxodonta africana TaxID=9785 RepID=G3TZS1_LOXAF